VRIQDNAIHENKISVELIKEAASESELNSIYLTQLLHDFGQSVVLTLTVVRTSLRISISISINILVYLHKYTASKRAALPSLITLTFVIQLF